MYEKISEIPIRKEKVRKLKDKICKEIANELLLNHKDIQVYLTNHEHDTQDWDFIISQEFYLLRLKDYIEDPNSFWAYEMRNVQTDTIVYQVSDKCLNIWLQEDYHFVWNFLNQREKFGHCDLNDLFNDYYFGYQFTNAFDIIHYNKKV